MNTDELVEMLSLDAKPVSRSSLVRTLSMAGVASGVAALSIAYLTLGVRPDLFEPRVLGFILIKFMFTIAVFGIALVYLTKLSRPGGGRRIRPLLAMIPFIVVITLGVISLGLAPKSKWDEMIVGDKWLECLVSIPFIAVVPFAICIWAVRQAAPTDLGRTGAFAGLVAGGVSAMAYAMHCMDDSLPFIAVWYAGTIALCTLTGAILGPRLLRW